MYITQFVSSNFEWDAAGLVLHQSHKPLNVEESVLEVTISFSRETTVGARAEEDTEIHIRIPAWAPGKGCRAYLNGKEIETPIPGIEAFLHHVDQRSIFLCNTINVDVIQVNSAIPP